MVVLIKTNNGTEDVCYVTRLVSDDMGTFDDLRHQVTEANNTGVTMSSSSKEVQFSVSDVTADVAMLGRKAAAICDSLAIVWLQRQTGLVLLYEGN